MYKTFKKGQRLKLKKLSKELCKYKCNPGIAPEMEEYFGKCVTIQNNGKAWGDTIIYNIQEDNTAWNYDVRWFEEPSYKLDIE